MADPVGDLVEELSELAGMPVPLERPSDAAHGDYATNVAMRLAGQRTQLAARGRGGAEGRVR